MFAPHIARYIFAWESAGVDSKGEPLPLSQWKAIFHKGAGESWVTGYGLNGQAHPSLAKKLEAGYTRGPSAPGALTYDEAYKYWYNNFYMNVISISMLPFRWQFMLADSQFLGRGQFRDTCYWLSSRLSVMTKGGVKPTPDWNSECVQAVIHLSKMEHRALEERMWSTYPSSIAAQVKAMAHGVKGHEARLRWRFDVAMRNA